jgi:Cu-Zn family superoxide dismutase
MKRTLGIAASVLLLGACAGSGTERPSAAAALRPASGSSVSGNITFSQAGPNRVRVAGEVSGHSAGPKGFHIHEKGDCSAPDAMSAGGHFNPSNMKHGPTPTAGHAGDMGNLAFNDAGRATVNMVLEGISVSPDAPNGIIGRAVVVHMQPDDLKTDPTGNAGGRAACGVIR